MIPSAAPAADGVDEVEGPQHLPSSANQASGVTGGTGTPPPPSQEDHSQAAHAVAATIPRSPSSTGGSGLSFQMTRPSRDRFVSWLLTPGSRGIR